MRDGQTDRRTGGQRSSAGTVRLSACAPVRLSLFFLLALPSCSSPGPAGKAEHFTVPDNATFGQVLDTLDAHGLIANRFIFKLRARLNGADRRVHAGPYTASRGTSMGALLSMLAEGRTSSVRFTIPEGLTIADVADIASRDLNLPADSFVAAAHDSVLADSLGIQAPSLEGFLHPDTYLLSQNTGARDLVGLLVRQFEDSWKPAWTARLDTLKLTRLQLVTLASIVEGEARVDSERETIAGVYRNRLRIGMALQADPTVQYAIQLATGERKKRLFTKDYRTPSPYNTYLHPGLPPGPVNSPSLRSIEASLYPADVPYLYFVARPDGHHIFSRTYEEHLRAIREARRATSGN
ncbi:MAG TPA: endolytic transglycosylase MltG [Gemmatimonadales bacterium]|nr:endolytic transglycosylase MltG [Gemmatimonadales bacterium]